MLTSRNSGCGAYMSTLFLHTENNYQNKITLSTTVFIKKNSYPNIVRIKIKL